MVSSLVVAVAGVSAVYIFLRALLHVTQDKREPPAIGTALPFLSPIFGMMSQKIGFYQNTRDKHGLPIYTLRLPGMRIYVVNSTALIPVAQRHFRSISFAPIQARASVNVVDSSKLANDIIGVGDTAAAEEFMMGFRKAIHSSLTPGESLDSLNRAATALIAGSLDRLQEADGETVNLHEWVCREMVQATTTAVFGPQNPLLDPKRVEDFFKFERGIMFFMMRLFPSVLARQSFKAREDLVVAFARYFEEGGHLDPATSDLIRARYDFCALHHIPVADIVRFEVTNLFAVLGNTLPTAFWVLFRLYANPDILEECRRELSKAVIRTEEESGPVYAIDAACIRTSCPVLLSALQEVLRCENIGISVRVMVEDHMLDGRYLLKKGATVMIPAPVQHSDPSVWGPSVGEFDPKRFLRPDKSAGASTSKRPNPVAFRGFGGGIMLCPGRHFASTEILVFAALTILRFDITPAENGGRWVMPSTSNTSMAATMPAPDRDIPVKISLRGPAQQRWRVSFSGSEEAMALSAEDINMAA